MRYHCADIPRRPFACRPSPPPVGEELDVSSCKLDGATGPPSAQGRRHGIEDPALADLPPSLEELDVTGCGRLTPGASFSHLPALHVLQCSNTAPVSKAVAAMPPSLVELYMNHYRNFMAAANLDHLRALRWLGNVRVWRYQSTRHSGLHRLHDPSADGRLASSGGRLHRVSVRGAAIASVAHLYQPVASANVSYALFNLACVLCEQGT